MSFSPNFFLSLGAVATAVLGGIYFLKEWRMHRGLKTALFWAMGFFGIFLFQVPTILFNARVDFALSRFGLFFSLALPVSFLSLICVYCGIVSLTRNIRKIEYVMFGLWLAACLAFFNYYFYQHQAFTTHAPLYAMILIFFLPIHLANLWALSAFHATNRFEKDARYDLGIIALLLGGACGIARNMLFLYGFESHAPQFWFLALQPESLFWFQMLGTAFFLFGFYFIHQKMKGIIAGHRIQGTNP